MAQILSVGFFRILFLLSVFFRIKFIPTAARNAPADLLQSTSAKR